MNKQFQTAITKIEALSARERAILFVLCTFGVLMVGFTLFVEPQLKMQKILKTQHLSNQSQAHMLQEEIAQLSAKAKIDPDTETRLKINEAKTRLALMDQELLTLKKNLVQAEKMDGLLQDMLKRNKRLQLISMKSLPVVNLIDASVSPPVNPAPAAGTGLANSGVDPATNVPVNTNTPANSNLSNNLPSQDERSIYKHEVELELQGNYLDMLAYIKALEEMPEQVYWSQSKLIVLEYPKANLKLRLFTLSLEKKWLNL